MKVIFVRHSEQDYSMLDKETIRRHMQVLAVIWLP